jgi:mannosyl-3-phosphoglycerate phosphatase
MNLMAPSTNVLIFTDLDGTLLDHDTYSWSAALPALARAADCCVPIIPCTSKTFDECLLTQKEIGLTGPFIFENGAGIALPQTVFRKPFQKNGLEAAGYWLCSLGTDYSKIRHALSEIRRSKRYQFRGFGDMSVEQIATATGLDHHKAVLAKERRFSEPLMWLDDAKTFDAFVRDVEQQGLTLTRGGRFIHAAGPSDKGKAAQWLARRFEYKLGSTPLVVALGDSKNDISMLTIADIAVVIRPKHTTPLSITAQNNKQKVMLTKKVGPEGWNEAILSILEDQEVVHG